MQAGKLHQASFFLFLVVDNDVFLNSGIYLDSPFSRLLNSLQNYLTTPYRGAHISEYRERTWNGLEAKEKRT